MEAAPVWVEGDQTRIEQILTNLLVNAARYTRQDGRIRVSVAREGDEAVLVVSDDGQGIAPENLPRVFELFFQAEATADRATGGLGIGLTLVQRLARFHGGDVTAVSGGRGQGATFTVRLPAIAGRAPVEDRTAPAPPGPAEIILVVEDNADARESLCLALELRGHRVLPAADGPAALDVLEREAPAGGRARHRAARHGRLRVGAPHARGAGGCDRARCPDGLWRGARRGRGREGRLRPAPDQAGRRRRARARGGGDAAHATHGGYAPLNAERIAGSPGLQGSPLAPL